MDCFTCGIALEYSGAPFAPERAVSMSLNAGALGRAATLSGGSLADGTAWANANGLERMRAPAMRSGVRLADLR